MRLSVPYGTDFAKRNQPQFREERKLSHSESVVIKMDLTVWNEKDQLFLKMTGDVDHHAVKDTRREVDDLILRNKPHTLVMDLSEIDFMDSSGLGFILGRLRVMNDIGGNVVVLNPAPRVKDMLHMAGTDKLVRILGSEKNNISKE